MANNNEWVIVPKKLSGKMLDALRVGSYRDRPSDELCRVRWAACLLAADANHDLEIVYRKREII